MDLVASAEGLQQRLLMHFKVERSYNRKKRLSKNEFYYSRAYLDDLELDLVVAFGNTVADGLYDGVNQLAREAPVHIRGRALVLRVETVVLAVPIEELI